MSFTFYVQGELRTGNRNDKAKLNCKYTCDLTSAHRFPDSVAVPIRYYGNDASRDRVMC